MIERTERRRLSAASGEEGFTLVELLVAIVILAVFLTLISGFFISSIKVVSVTQQTEQGTATASNVMNELSRVIRTGTETTVVGNSDASPAFLAGTNESLTMYGYVDSSYVSVPSASCASSTLACATQVQPQIVQLTVDPTSRLLIEKRWSPTASSGDSYTFPALTSTPKSTRTIGGPLLPTPAPTGSAPIFTYLDSTGTPITPSASGLTCAQRGTVSAVEVTVRVAGASSSARPNIILQNTIQLPNLGAAGDTAC